MFRLGLKLFSFIAYACLIAHSIMLIGFIVLILLTVIQLGIEHPMLRSLSSATLFNLLGMMISSLGLLFAQWAGKQPFAAYSNKT